MDAPDCRPGRRTGSGSVDRGRALGPHPVRRLAPVRGRTRSGDPRESGGAVRHRRTHHLGQQPRARDRRRGRHHPGSPGGPHPALRIGRPDRNPPGNCRRTRPGACPAAQQRGRAGDHAPDLPGRRQARTHGSPHHGGAGPDSGIRRVRRGRGVAASGLVRRVRSRAPGRRPVRGPRRTRAAPWPP